MIYLDNASTSHYKPKVVVDAVVDCITNMPYNPNRANNEASLRLQQKLYQTRQKLHEIYRNDSPSNVVFTSGCTQAINLAIFGNARRGHIIVSCYEHNAVLRTVMQLQKQGFCQVSVAMPDNDGEITPQELQKHVREDTFLLCVNHCSNVTGHWQKMAQIGNFAHKNNLLLLCDCAQSVGHIPLDMAKCGVDMVAIGSHKGLHGIQGAGALIFNHRATPKPISFGGTGTESHNLQQPTTVPDGLESGTLPCPAIISMDAGIDWWVANWKQNQLVVEERVKLLLDGLGSIDKVKLYSAVNKCGIVSFAIGNTDSQIIADTLATNYNIAVRGGLHCAPLVHRYLNTLTTGLVRVSVSCVTTKQDCYKLISAVKDICKHQR